MNQLQDIIPSRIKIWQDAKPDEIYSVVFCDKMGRQIALKTNTNDSGIAVVTCYRYLKSVASTCEYRAVFVQYPGASDIEMISEASNILLAHLDEDNSILVAAFISMFNTDSTATDIKKIERELKNAEESYCGRSCRSVDDIKTAYRYIWKTYLFIESTGMVDFCTVNNFKELRDSVSDPHELLFWSILLCFWGDYDAKNPHALFQSIRERKYILYFKKDKYFILSLFGI